MGRPLGGAEAHFVPLRSAIRVGMWSLQTANTVRRTGEFDKGERQYKRVVEGWMSRNRTRDLKSKTAQQDGVKRPYGEVGGRDKLPMLRKEEGRLT